LELPLPAGKGSGEVERGVGEDQEVEEEEEEAEDDTGGSLARGYDEADSDMNSPAIASLWDKTPLLVTVPGCSNTGSPNQARQATVLLTRFVPSGVREQRFREPTSYAPAALQCKCLEDFQGGRCFCVLGDEDLVNKWHILQSSHVCIGDVCPGGRVEQISFKKLIRPCGLMIDNSEWVIQMTTPLSGSTHNNTCPFAGKEHTTGASASELRAALNCRCKPLKAKGAEEMRYLVEGLVDWEIVEYGRRNWLVKYKNYKTTQWESEAHLVNELGDEFFNFVDSLRVSMAAGPKEPGRKRRAFPKVNRDFVITG